MADEAVRNYVPVDLIGFNNAIGAGADHVTVSYPIPQGKALEIKSIEVIPDFNTNPAIGPIGASGLDYCQLEVDESSKEGYRWFINGASTNQLPCKNGIGTQEPKTFGLFGAELHEMFERGEITQETMQALAGLQLTPKIRNSVTLGIRVKAMTATIAAALDDWLAGVTERYMVRVRCMLYENDAIVKTIWGPGASLAAFDTLRGGVAQGAEVFQYYNVLFNNKDALAQGPPSSLFWYPGQTQAPWSIKEQQLFKIEKLGTFPVPTVQNALLWIDGSKQYPAKPWDLRYINNILPWNDETLYGGAYKLEPSLTINNMSLELQVTPSGVVPQYAFRAFMEGIYMRLSRDTMRALGLGGL